MGIFEGRDKRGKSIVNVRFLSWDLPPLFDRIDFDIKNRESRQVNGKVHTIWIATIINPLSLRGKQAKVFLIDGKPVWIDILGRPLGSCFGMDKRI